jgi:protein-L-isoaspartate(D-aspartate) O-methyltransferase
MVEGQLAARGITDLRVLEAMNAVPRERFVSAAQQAEAYDDGPLPIGYGQTISQPFTVAFMAQSLQLQGDENVLEVGTGCGYAAAVLSLLAAQVHTIERIPELAEQALLRLGQLGFDNVPVHAGDGTLGLPEFAPYDAIVAAASAASLPSPYIEELSEDGMIVLPLGQGTRGQRMCRFIRRNGQIEREDLGGFAFVPLIGRHGWSE